MSRSKKRKRNDDDTLKREHSSCSGAGNPVLRDVFGQYYESTTTLRDYVLASLPRSSRLRRKKISSLCSNPDRTELEKQLVSLLDNALVCTPASNVRQDEVRWAQWAAFSSAQRHDDSTVTISNGLADSHFCQSEIVDFVIWLLFRREAPGARPKHLLCDGFRKTQRENDNGRANIEGAYSLYPNSQVAILKDAPWPQLLKLLGQSGEKIMINLLLDTSIFVPVQAGFQNYYQLSGVPISELDLSSYKSLKYPSRNARQPSDITLVRSRIFYARPAMSSKGTVRPGFKHIHILNRCPFVPKDNAPVPASLAPSTHDLNKLKVTMHIFPRQFGLHNVFTSQIDRTKTAQKFQDYTMREDEIGRLLSNTRRACKPGLPKIPKRLRRDAARLVERLQILHRRCSYLELLNHYCPAVLSCMRRNISRTPTQGQLVQPGQSLQHHAGISGTSQVLRRTRRLKMSRHPLRTTQQYTDCRHESITELAIHASSVSAFCRATLLKMIPQEFWGSDEVQVHNLEVLCAKIDHFVRLRRFETMSLHEISQDFKISGIQWLQQPGQGGQKPCQSETNKRTELFLEFLFFVFDTLLMPLIRSNFYVTESNTDRNQIFYFRHDVWRHIAEPALTTLKHDMFEEVKLADAATLLRSRRLGYSQIRLLPKGAKMRPIMNLRRRVLRLGPSKSLGPSINSVLSPVHTMLKFETANHPERLGGAMFSIGELHTRLKAFKARIRDAEAALYFVKLDVRAAFDTIPQAAAVELMRNVPSLRRYVVNKHAEVKPGERLSLDDGDIGTTPIRRWHSTATSAAEDLSFLRRLERDLAPKKKSTVFVDSAMSVTQDSQALYNLLNEHVTNNIVKVGKKFYRQKRGIPQGSVLSSFLCNYFYADLEHRVLDFLSTPDCLLLRLIDDFLLIALDRSKAERFLEVMHGGLPEYGVKVSPEKTLVNFDVCSSQGPVQRIESGGRFPYCGTLIDCRSLEIQRDRRRDPGLNIANSLTIEYGRAQGHNFQRKVLGFFKIQSHLMFFDGSHNTAETVHESIHGAFRETARKMWAYMRCLPPTMQPTARLVIRTIGKLVDVAYLLLTGNSRTLRDETYVCDIRKARVARIAHRALLEVLSRKQTRFAETVAWLQAELEKAE